NTREIQIGGQYDVAMLPRKPANLLIGRRRRSGGGPVQCVVSGVIQIVNPAGCEIHVYQKPHQLASGNSRPCARDAANASASRISSASRYGKSRNNSSMDRPAAIASTIMPTVTRIPRIQGFPPITSGFVEMRLNCGTSSGYHRKSIENPVTCRSSKISPHYGRG